MSAQDIPGQSVEDAFADPNGLFGLLRTVRSRRIGRGYDLDTGLARPHPVTGRPLSQIAGPLAFTSTAEPLALTDTESALIAWAACGPNGLTTWELAQSGGFNTLTTAGGRTAPSPSNAMATDLLVIDDSGVALYAPGNERRGPVEVPPDDQTAISEWWDGRYRLMDRRPDFDVALRSPDSPLAPLNIPAQHNLNRPGSSWFLPVTDAGKVNLTLVDMLGAQHKYVVDDFAGGKPAGLDKFIGPGRLELGVPLSAQEQASFQAEMYSVGCIVQNIRLACELMGLGAWSISGFSAELLFGAMPAVTSGIGWTNEPPNPRTPVATGRIKTLGVPGVKESTYVPSPRYPTGKALALAWKHERYGDGGWAAQHNGGIAEGNYPWEPSRAAEFRNATRAEPAEYVWEAIAAYIDYCVDTYGQWPVTYNPMQAHFGVVVHHVDPAFYDRHLRPGYITDRIRTHDSDWH